VRVKTFSCRGHLDTQGQVHTKITKTKPGGKKPKQNRNRTKKSGTNVHKHTSDKTQKFSRRFSVLFSSQSVDSCSEVTTSCGGKKGNEGHGMCMTATGFLGLLLALKCKKEVIFR